MLHNVPGSSLEGNPLHVFVHVVDLTFLVFLFIQPVAASPLTLSKILQASSGPDSEFSEPVLWAFAFPAILL
jgi:hypothetical protein